MQEALPEFRVLVTGSRDFSDAALFDATIRETVAGVPPERIVLIEGGARGLDKIARTWAEDNDVDFETYRANWKRDGKQKAGPLRNQKMVDTGADVCLAFPLPGSIGTYDCMRRATKAGIRVVHVRSVNA